jgi:hypothetical protein
MAADLPVILLLMRDPNAGKIENGNKWKLGARCERILQLQNKIPGGPE